LGKSLRTTIQTQQLQLVVKHLLQCRFGRRRRRRRRSLGGLVHHSAQLVHELFNSSLGFFLTGLRLRYSLLQNLHHVLTAMWVVRVWDVIVALFFHHFHYHSRILVIRHFTQQVTSFFINASDPIRSGFIFSFFPPGLVPLAGPDFLFQPGFG